MKYWREPLDKSNIKTPRGEIHLIKERCKGCAFCIEFCPKKCLEQSEEFNEKGYYFPVLKNDNETFCVNCGLCELLCPEFAIYSVKIETEGENIGN